MFRKNKRHRIITGLDIGTTKVCAIIGRVDEEDNLSILGRGSCPSRGIQRGEIVEIQATVNAIIEAVGRAQDVAGTPLGEIYVGIAGEHIRSENNRATVDIRHPTRGIGEKDRRRAIEKALDIAVPDSEALIQSVVQDFCVNGRHGIANPIGLSGSSLEVRTHIVFSCVDALNNIIRCTRAAGLGDPHIVLQSLASSLSVLNRNELELGTILIDIGGGTTDLAILHEGAIRATHEVPIGGDRITRDVARVLQCSMADAENVKKRYGCAYPDMVEKGLTFELPHVGNLDMLRTHEEHTLAEVIEASLEDYLFSEAAAFIERSGYVGRLHAGAVLTGGSALIPGITDVAERMLEIKCRTGEPRVLQGLYSAVKSPIYSTGVGLILYGMGPEMANPEPPRRGLQRLLDYLVDVFA